MDYSKNYTYQNPYTTNQQTKTIQNQTGQPYYQQPQILPNQTQFYQQQPQAYPNLIEQNQTNSNTVLELLNINDILNLNKGKVGTFYFTYTNSSEWRDRVYKGVIETASKDYLIISDPKTGRRYLFQSVYLDWVEFDEEISYEPPYR